MRVAGILRSLVSCLDDLALELRESRKTNDRLLNELERLHPLVERIGTLEERVAILEDERGGQDTWPAPAPETETSEELRPSAAQCLSDYMG